MDASHYPDAKITKMKDGRTHLAHKTEHALDLQTGAIVAVTVQDADDGDAETSIATLITAAEQIEAVLPAAMPCTTSAATRGITPISRSPISKLWGCVATYNKPFDLFAKAQKAEIGSPVWTRTPPEVRRTSDLSKCWDWQALRCRSFADLTHDCTVLLSPIQSI